MGTEVAVKLEDVDQEPQIKVVLYPRGIFCAFENSHDNLHFLAVGDGVKADDGAIQMSETSDDRRHLACATPCWVCGCGWD